MLISTTSNSSIKQFFLKKIVEDESKQKEWSKKICCKKLSRLLKKIEFKEQYSELVKICSVCQHIM